MVEGLEIDELLLPFTYSKLNLLTGENTTSGFIYRLMEILQESSKIWDSR